MSIKLRLSSLERLKKVTPINTEMMEVLEKLFASHPKSPDEQRAILKTLECSEENRELILFAIKAEEEHGNDPQFNKMVVEYGNS
jgi:hypothetical protein